MIARTVMETTSIKLDIWLGFSNYCRFAYAEYNLMLSLTAVILSMSFWWRDVIAKGILSLNSRILFNYNFNIARVIVKENSILNRVNNSFVLQSKLYYLPKPPVFSSMPLQSGIFTINSKFIIGLISSLITAAIGYGIRLILLNYLEYDVFTNLNNLFASLSYFCSLGGIRFVISEYLKENTLLMSYCGGPSPVGSNAAGSNLTMQAPNNSGIGSSSAGDASNIDERLKLEQRASKVREKNALL